MTLYVEAKNVPVPDLCNLIASSARAGLDVPTCWKSFWALLLQLDQFNYTPEIIKGSLREFAVGILLMLEHLPSSGHQISPRDSSLVIFEIQPNTIFAKFWNGFRSRCGWPENMRRYLKDWKQKSPDDAGYGESLLDLLSEFVTS